MPEQPTAPAIVRGVETFMDPMQLVMFWTTMALGLGAIIYGDITVDSFRITMGVALIAIMNVARFVNAWMRRMGSGNA